MCTKMVSIQLCQNVLTKFLGNQNFQIITYGEKQLSENCGNFMIKINYIFEKCKKESSFVGKTINDQKESQYYETASDNFSLRPKLIYHTNKLLIFEDYLGQNYQHCRLESYDIEHVKEVLKSLAFFHACNLLHIEKASQVFNDTNSLSAFNFDEIKLMVSKQPKLQKNVNEIVEFAKNVLVSRKLVKVLCHGFTSKLDNFYFRYDDHQRPIDCLLTNFENVVYGSPVLDVLMLIYSTTNLKTRQYVFDELLNWYYSRLRAELSYKQADIKNILPRKKDFDVAVYCYLPFIKLVTFSTNFNDENVKQIEQLIDTKSLFLEDIFVIVKNKLKSANFNLVSYNLATIKGGSGYLGSPNKLTIDVLTENNQKLTMNMFAKLLPTTSIQIEFLDDAEVFFKEIFIYDHLIPLYQTYGLNFVDECIVPCYFTRHNQIIVMEDFAKKGYEILDSRKFYSCEVVEMILKKLAKWHACSLITEEKLTKKNGSPYRFIDHHAKELQEAYMLQKDNHMGARWVERSIDAVQHQVAMFQNLFKSNLDWPTLCTKIGQMYELMFELVQPSKKFRNVICHGDLWANNVFLKFSDGKPTDCRLIDFQLCRYCPPAQDVLSLIHITMERNQIKQNLKNLLNLYYRELSDILSQHLPNAKDVYSYQEFIESVEYMKPQAVCQALLYCQLGLVNENIGKMFFGTEEDARKTLLVDRKPLITHLFEQDPLYRERAQVSVLNLIEICESY